MIGVETCAQKKEIGQMMNKTMYMHGAFGIHLNILKNKGTDICYINKFAYMCYDDSMT